MLVSPEGVRLERSLRLGFRLSNNKAEYEALIVGLKAAKKLDAEMIEIFFKFTLGGKSVGRKF